MQDKCHSSGSEIAATRPAPCLANFEIYVSQRVESLERATGVELATSSLGFSTKEDVFLFSD
jgi:hypothetical protein